MTGHIIARAIVIDFAVMFDSLSHVAVRAAILLLFRGLLRKGHVIESDCKLLRRVSHDG